MLSRKSKKRLGEFQKAYPPAHWWLIRLALIVFLSAGSVFATAQPVGADPCTSTDKPTKPTALLSCEGKNGNEPNIIEQACELIYKGNFDAADELIKQSGQGSSRKESQSLLLSKLAKIVEESRSISQQRRLARETAYKEQLAELEKLRAKIDVNDVKDANDRTDANDVNDITTALSVIVRACEFAEQTQKEQLLSNSFVKRVLQKAIDKAAAFEVKGKWLEAYTNCYLWLQAIEPNNKAYSDYAEQLLDKAGIAASFQDSPCETREQRYAGVQKEMFVRAIDALSLNYISIIDYSQMATKAIERCKLLAEVLLTLDTQNPDKPALLESRSSGEPNKMQLKTQNPKLKTAEVAAWSASLAALADEVHQSPTGFDKDKFIGVFEKVLTLNTATVDLPAGVLIAQFSEAALSALDPYTVMVWPKQVDDFEKMMTNEFTGIGIEVSKEKGLLTVASLLPDTPAYKAGLDAGDVIEAVDGVGTKDMTLICAVHKITGPKGTKVTLTIKREGFEKPKEFPIIRDKITVPTIRGWSRQVGKEGKWSYLIDEQNKIGYVRISSFSAQTTSDLEEVLKQLEAAGIRGLILDLRFNSGGLLDSAVDVADKFLKNRLIVKTQPGSALPESRGGRIPTYAVAHENGTHPDYPLVILINSGSASASEIVAGALADAAHKRAILVGERTHGKGSVQGVTRYPGGGAQLKYTMSYYYLPSGQRVESREMIKKQDRSDWGVGPNIEVELTSDELRKMIEVQRDNDVLFQPLHSAPPERLGGSGGPGQGKPQQVGEPQKPNSINGSIGVTREPKKHTIEETLTADPQLAIGVLIVKTKLIQKDSG